MIDWQIHHYQEVDSTMDIADELMQDFLKQARPKDKGIVVVADKQRKGRGRLGRSWYSPEGGLWFTLGFIPKPNENIGLFSLLSAIGVAKTINKNFNLEVLLKWPNDVLINYKKIAGILVEAKLVEAKFLYLLIGIGVNLNIEKFPDNIADIVTSLSLILKKNINKESFLSFFLDEFNSLYSLFNQEDFSSLIKEYKVYDCILHKPAKVISSKVYEGTPVDINYDGSLKFLTKDKKLINLYSGDVKLII
jgi:BirA family biotin operon repressor/biotin-[acetyl-CoA-carboxylase] ligase